MPTAEVSIPSGPLEPAAPRSLERQVAAERSMVRSVIVGIFAALPITVAVTIGLIGIAISDKEPWYIWIGLGTGIGIYAAAFFGTCAGVVLSSHLFDELDQDASNQRENPSLAQVEGGASDSTTA
jgi:membrane associated rhomboid family serine protease